VSVLVRTQCCADLARWLPGGNWLRFIWPREQALHAQLMSAPAHGGMQKRIRVTDFSQKLPNLAAEAAYKNAKISSQIGTCPDGRM